MYMVVDYFTRIDQYNLFVGFTKLSSKLSLTILILIKYTKLVGFTRLISYFSFYYSYLALICILLSPSPKPRRFPPDSRYDPVRKARHSW